MSFLRLKSRLLCWKNRRLTIVAIVLWLFVPIVAYLVLSPTPDWPNDDWSKYDIQHGILTLSGSLPGKGIDALAVSPDQRLLASSGGRQTRLWDISSGFAQYETIHPDRAGNHLCFLPDGRWLAMASLGDTQVRLWHLERRESLTLQGFDAPDPRIVQTTGISCSPDGNLLAAANHAVGAVKIWETNSRREKATLRFSGDDGVEHLARSLAFSGDGKTLAVSHSPLRFVKTSLSLFWVDSLVRYKILETGCWESHGVRFLKNGSALVLIWDHSRAELWNFADERQTHVMSIAPGYIYAGDITPDGKIAIFCGQLGSHFPGFIELRELTTGKKLTRLDAHRGGVCALAVFPDGKRFATGGVEGNIEIWDLDTVLKLSAE